MPYSNLGLLPYSLVLYKLHHRISKLKRYHSLIWFYLKIYNIALLFGTSERKSFCYTAHFRHVRLYSKNIYCLSFVIRHQIKIKLMPITHYMFFAWIFRVLRFWGHLFIAYLGCRILFTAKVSNKKFPKNPKTLKSIQKHVVCTGLRAWFVFYRLFVTLNMLNVWKHKNFIIFLFSLFAGLQRTVLFLIPEYGCLSRIF